jgi:predicted RNase H-like HicB family nuclease
MRGDLDLAADDDRLGTNNRKGSMLSIDLEREEDGRWLAEVPALPGVLVYGATPDDAKAKVKALALRVIADRFENGEPLPKEVSHLFEAA